MLPEKEKKLGLVKRFFYNRQQRKEKERVIDLASMIDKGRKMTNKLEEDLKKMTQLELVDGKLQPARSKTPEDGELEAPRMVKQNDNFMPPFEQPILQKQTSSVGLQEEMSMSQPQAPMSQAPMSQAPMSQAPMSQAPMSQEAYEQPAVVSSYQQEQQPQLPTQEIPPQPPLMPQIVKIHIRLIEGLTFDLQVDGQSIKEFLDRLDTSIIECAPFQLDNQVINGKHIVYYTIVA